MNWKISMVVLSFIALFVGCKNEIADKQSEKQSDTRRKDVKNNPSEGGDSTSYENGVRIHWIKKGAGDSLRTGDLVEIEYKVFLEDGRIVEGSHLFDGTFPFLVGYHMQTPGWDFILQKLKVGDEIEAFLPAKLARGEKGIKGMIPPNSNNILYLKIVEKRQPDKKMEGVKVYYIAQNKSNKELFDEQNTIVFHTMASTANRPNFVNTFADNRPFTYQMKNPGIVPGLKKALLGARKADRMYVVVTPEWAYGVKGYLDIVKPNESVFYNLYVVDVY